jgi:entericidin B
MIREKVIVLILAIGLVAGVAGCNTVKGAGKDVQSAGKAVERASDKARH